MNLDIEQAKAMFREEACEILAELESSLLELEKSPDNPELVDSVFRAMHTMKGTGSMFGFDRISEFTHQLETAFDLIRDGQMKVTKPMIDLTLRARDLLFKMLEDEDVSAETEGIINSIKALVPDGVVWSRPSKVKKADLDAALASREALAETSEPAAYRIRFQPSKGLMSTGTNPLFLLRELRELGDCAVIAHTEKIPLLDAIDPEACYAYWDIVLLTDKGLDAIRGVFIFVETDSKIRIEKIAEPGEIRGLDAAEKICEAIAERGDISPDELEGIISQFRLADEAPDGGAECETPEEAGIMQKDWTVASIRVPATRLDALADLVGELVTTQARLTQISALKKDPELTKIAEEVEHLTEELRDNTMSIRMLPIGTTFAKFRRLVRDLSGELGKEVRLTTEGAETELDKTVIEKLDEPLVHLIRNCIDHGIEPPEERRNAGKPERGTIILSAAHSGGDVLITIADDGRGLDFAAIRRKAVERGMIEESSELAEEEIHGLVFMPGFSTSTNVTSVSGRGVGMDVVKKRIDSLRGSVSIESKKGEGTSIILKLPLTLAIIEGLLVRLGGDVFAMPLFMVEECIELTASDSERTHGRNIVNVRGEIVPFIRLREYFFIPGERPPIEQVAIVREAERRFGIAVDTVIGEHQTVIKSLGKYYKNIEGVSGATILGDGTVALILDIPRLLKMVEFEEEAVNSEQD